MGDDGMNYIIVCYIEPDVILSCFSTEIQNFGHVFKICLHFKDSSSFIFFGAELKNVPVFH